MTPPGAARNGRPMRGVYQQTEAITTKKVPDTFSRPQGRPRRRIRGRPDRDKRHRIRDGRSIRLIIRQLHPVVFIGLEGKRAQEVLVIGSTEGSANWTCENKPVPFSLWANYNRKGS